MNKNILPLILASMLALCASACGDGGGNDNLDAGNDATTEEDAGDAGDAGPDCVEDPTTLPAQATFETNLRFLNQCTTSQYRDFDNATRIQHPLYVPGGPYPAF